jgi:hypothetical protein
MLAALLGQKENTVRQRLREWCCAAEDKGGSNGQEIDVSGCFTGLLNWALRWWGSQEKRLGLPETEHFYGNKDS